MTITSDMLHDQFRLDVSDTVAPFLWSDAEIYSYIDSAQKWLCRKVEGIGDASSTLTQMPINVNDEWKSISPLILRFRDAYVTSDGSPIEIINYEDLTQRRIQFDGNTGPIQAMIIGMEPGRIRLYPIASVADTLQLIVERLPLKTISDTGQNLEVLDMHFDGMMYWVKHMAYNKQDAETLDKKASDDYKEKFENYCKDSFNEKQRAKHKTRVVAYGGIGHNDRRRYGSFGVGNGFSGDDYGQ